VKRRVVSSRSVVPRGRRVAGRSRRACRPPRHHGCSL